MSQTCFFQKKIKEDTKTQQPVLFWTFQYFQRKENKDRPHKNTKSLKWVWLKYFDWWKYLTRGILKPYKKPDFLEIFDYLFSFVKISRDFEALEEIWLLVKYDPSPTISPFIDYLHDFLLKGDEDKKSREF